MNDRNALRRAIEHFGGQQSFGNRLGVSQGLISHWLNNRVFLTPDRCRQIEAATEGRVTMQQLRPDWFEGDPAVRKRRPQAAGA